MSRVLEEMIAEMQAAAIDPPLSTPVEGWTPETIEAFLDGRTVGR